MKKEKEKKNRIIFLNSDPTWLGFINIKAPNFLSLYIFFAFIYGFAASLVPGWNQATCLSGPPAQGWSLLHRDGASCPDPNSSSCRLQKEQTSAGALGQNYAALWDVEWAVGCSCLFTCLQLTNMLPSLGVFAQRWAVRVCVCVYLWITKPMTTDSFSLTLFSLEPLPCRCLGPAQVVHQGTQVQAGSSDRKDRQGRAGQAHSAGEPGRQLT